MPGDAKPEYNHASQARQVLNDAEDDLRDWQPETDNYNTQSTHGAHGTHGTHGTQDTSVADESTVGAIGDKEPELEVKHEDIVGEKATAA